MEDLPSLNTARAHHGCSLYTTDTGEKVNISTDERMVLQYCLSQVYVVMGGCGWVCFSLLSSTEMLSEREDTWRERAPLPRPLNALRSVSLGNVIYLTGQMIILRVWSLWYKMRLLTYSPNLTIFWHSNNYRRRGWWQGPWRDLPAGHRDQHLGGGGQDEDSQSWTRPQHHRVLQGRPVLSVMKQWLNMMKVWWNCELWILISFENSTNYLLISFKNENYLKTLKQIHLKTLYYVRVLIVDKFA